MQKFYIILSDQDGNIDWRHPNELNGQSKQEVYNLILQDVSKEFIVDILTAEEYDNKYVNKTSSKGQRQNNVNGNISEMSSDQFENGNDFFNAMLKAGTQIGEDNQENFDNTNKNNKKKIKVSNKNIKVKENIIESETENVQDQEYHTQYFEEGGIKFKLENGKLYKKVWKQILLNGQKTPDGGEAVSEFRLVSTSTKKLVSVEKVELQRLEWEEVKTH